MLETRPRARLVLLLLAISIYAVNVLPRISDVDMFFDGVHFAATARNLAEGIGTFWTPQLTQTYNFGKELTHPPLSFGALSVFYHIFGQSTLVEELYGVALGLLTLFLLATFWRRSNAHASAWFPVLLFVTLPIFPALTANNFLEVLQAVFILLAALSYQIALKSNSSHRLLGYAAGAGTMILLASLTKGPASFFIITMPSIYALFRLTPITRAIAVTVASLFGGGLVAFLVIGLNPEALESTTAFYKGMVAQSLAGVGKTGSRFFIFKSLFQNLSPALAILGLAALVSRFRDLPKIEEKTQLRLAGALFLLGLAGSLPFIVTEKQYARYFYPAFIFFILSFAFFAERLALQIERMSLQKVRVVQGLTAVMAVATLILCVARVGKVSRNHGYHKDFTLQKPMGLPERTVASVCPQGLTHDWPLYMDIQRHLKVSLSKIDDILEYHLVENGKGCTVPDTCTLFHPQKSHRFKLYKCESTVQSTSLNF